MSQIINLGAGNGGGGANQYVTDAGIAVPAAGILNVFGAHGINTAGAGNTVTIAIDNAITLGDLAVIPAGSNALSATTGDINVDAGNIKLPNTNGSGSEGEIMFGGSRFISNFGTFNVFVGESSGNTTVTGQMNTGYGTAALTSITNGSFNVGIGTGSLDSITSGSWNTAVGQTALSDITTAFYNTAIGYNAGRDYTGTESSNILINHKGIPGESNAIRIGNITGATNERQNTCYIQGIYSQTISSNAASVRINTTTGQLGIGNGSIVSWTVVTGASQTISVNNGYIANNAGTVAFSLPTTSAVGDIFEITSINNATGWSVTQAAGQQIRFGSSTTTLGAGGSLAATANGDSIRAVCTIANTFWNVISSVGNITIV